MSFPSYIGVTQCQHTTVPTCTTVPTYYHNTVPACHRITVPINVVPQYSMYVMHCAPCNTTHPLYHPTLMYHLYQVYHGLPNLPYMPYTLSLTCITLYTSITMHCTAMYADPYGMSAMYALYYHVSCIPCTTMYAVYYHVLSVLPCIPCTNMYATYIMYYNIFNKLPCIPCVPLYHILSSTAGLYAISAMY